MWAINCRASCLIVPSVQLPLCAKRYLKSRFAVYIWQRRRGKGVVVGLCSPFYPNRKCKSGPDLKSMAILYQIFLSSCQWEYTARDTIARGTTVRLSTWHKFTRNNDSTLACSSTTWYDDAHMTNFRKRESSKYCSSGRSVLDKQEERKNA